MKLLIILTICSSIISAQAGRGGGGGGGEGGGRGFSEGGFTEHTNEEGLSQANFGSFNTSRNLESNGYSANLNTERGPVQVEGNYDRVGDVQRASVGITEPNGYVSSASVTRVGNQPETFNGYRTGYYYVNGGYNQVNLTPDATYIAPVGAFAGWGVYTTAEYINYPSYATYPIETALQIQLTNQGYYTGEIDGNIQSVTQAISDYQSKNGLQVTGQINRDLLTQLGISCALPQE